MKQRNTTLLATLALGIACISTAQANHRTGSFILPELMGVGDFNEDGNLDIVVNSAGFDHVALLFGDSNGNFTLGGHFSTDTLPKGLVVGDVNRDGHLDVVDCTVWGYDAIVLFGDGKGALHRVSPPSEIDGDGEPSRLLLYDFNKDRNLDLVESSPDDNKIQIYFGDGTGNFPGPPMEILDITKPLGMAGGDVNGDGNIDFVVVSGVAHDSAINLFLNDGTGKFTVSKTPVGGSPASVKLGDLNGDGKLDVVVAGAVPGNSSGNFIYTYLGDGTGQFTLKQILRLGSGRLSGEVALGDFNEDGAPDLAFPNNPNQSDASVTTPNLLLFFGDGTGNFVAQPPLTVGTEPNTVITTDFNKDGHLDLAVTARTDGTVQVLLGDGHGGFTIFSTTSVLSPLP
jgi:hypothetical protein